MTDAKKQNEFGENITGSTTTVRTANESGIWVQGDVPEIAMTPVYMCPAPRNPPIVAHYMVSPPMDLNPPPYVPYEPSKPMTLVVTDPRISEMVVQMAQLVEEVRRLTDALEKLAARKKR